MKKIVLNFCWIIILPGLLACTKKSEPIVTELNVIPNSFSIISTPFLSKPFTVMAKYSDDKTENVSNKVRWISENSSLVNVSNEGELQKNGVCDATVCTVSLVVTHPGSGQSQRVEVKLFPEKAKDNAEKKTPAVMSESEQPVDSSANNEAQTDDSDPTPDETTGDAPDGVEKSVLLTDTPSAEPAESSASDTVKQITTIAFAADTQLIISGQLFKPEVVADLPKTVITESHYSCVIDNSAPDVLTIENGCYLRAMAPGKASIKLLTSDPEFVSNALLEVEVIPLEISNSQVSALNITMAENQTQMWLRLTNITPGEVLRYSAKGALQTGFQLFILNALESNQGACLNTVPVGFNEVACIIKPLFDQIYVVLQKPQGGLTELNLASVALPAEILTYSLANNSDNTQNLLKDNKIRAYILANEFGLYNRHFYQYVPDASDKNGFRVLLSEFDAAPSLEVFWANGYCSDNKLKTGPEGISCEIPSDNVGNVWITINANMAGGAFNGPAAQTGGTYYSLQVTNVSGQ